MIFKLWAGSQETLWSIQDVTLLTHIQIIFQAIYPDMNLAIVLNGAIFLLLSGTFSHYVYLLHNQTMQHISKWWSNFGSTAIVIIYDFLMSNSNCVPEVLTGLLFNNYAFIFKDMDKCDPDGAFHSVFILQLIRKVHLTVINGHTNIPALKTKDLTLKGMASVIVFCTTANRIRILDADSPLQVQ
ncbi:hypothetical protein EDB19DRAFT_1839290 [Suillus lakei]|nr:hypothetical protein EDB19DRAFT_1839290 [Suillus lakei]